MKAILLIIFVFSSFGVTTKRHNQDKIMMQFEYNLIMLEQDYKQGKITDKHLLILQNEIEWLKQNH